MPYKQTATPCVVRLVALRGLSPARLAQCQAVRAEAGRLWTDLIRLHTQARAQGQWLSAGEFELATKDGQYTLHSQSVQALCQKFAANVDTATEVRRQEMSELGHVQTAYPHHPKTYQTVVWKDQALTILPSGSLRLPTGAQRPPLLLPLPSEYQTANLRRTELTWRADHYELCLTLDSGAALPPPLPTGAVAGVDLGEVHVAARAADALAKDGIGIDLIDLRTIWPWDKKRVFDSVAKTKRLIVAHEAVAVAGFGAEIIATVAEQFDGAVAVRRLGAPRAPVGYAPPVEDAVRVSEAAITAAAWALVEGAAKGVRQ